MRLEPRATAAPGGGDLVPAALRGRRWVTRPRPHVDRLGSAWLIKRFIDPDAEFVFARPDEFPPDAIPFDALGAEFGHQGEDCTFETLIKRCGLRDERLRELAEIVHEVDLRDDKYRRAEARGIDLAIRGLLAALKDDHAALARGALRREPDPARRIDVLIGAADIVAGRLEQSGERAHSGSADADQVLAQQLQTENDPVVRSFMEAALQEHQKTNRH